MIYWIKCVFLLINLISLQAYSSEYAIPKAFHSIASSENVPVKVLYAITLQESQAKTNLGRVIPWIYTLNDGEKGYYYKTSAELKAHILFLLSQDNENFDVGIGQINYRWHKDNFSSIDEMIDPVSNLRYAAKYLKKHYGKYNNWWLSVGAYHAPVNKALADSYMKKVYKKWLKL